MMEAIQKIFRRGDRLKKSRTTSIGSTLIVMSTLLPCTDVILKWLFPSIIGVKDSTGVLITINIWLGSLYFGPTLILIAVMFKPNQKLFILPITMYLYSGMVYFAPTFGYKINFLKFNSILTAVYSILAAFAIMFIIRYVKRLVFQENVNELFLEDVREEFERLTQEIDDLKAKLKTHQK